jgi:proline iminopeptidase
MSSNRVGTIPSEGLDALAPGAHRVTIDGLDQHYHVAGQGPVCIAHSGGPGISWNYLRMPEVERHLTLLYLEPIGTGASGRLADPRDYNLHRYANQLDGLITQLELEQPLLLGHSHGGFVSLRYQVDHPGRLSGLILYDTSPVTTEEFWGDMQGELERAAERHAGEPWVADTMAAWQEMFSIPPDTHPSEADLSGILHRMMPIYFADYMGMKDVLDPMVAAMTLFEGPNHGVERAPFDVRTQLGSIAIPTLVIAGQADPVCSVRWSRAIHDGIPGSTLALFEQSGHFAHIEEPAAFAKAIGDWLAATHPETT